MAEHVSQPIILNVERMLTVFKSTLLKDKPDMDSAQSQLRKLKIQLINFKLFPPFDAPESVYKKHLLLAREVYELAVILSLKVKDFPSYERHIALVKPYYFDFGALLPDSERKWPTLGANLLGLLAHNRIAEFHTELELISIDARTNNFIRYPVEIEQHLMEGSYNKVLTARKSMPHDSYGVFLDMLVDTVREEIAECSQTAYESIPLRDAPKLLMLDSEQKVNEFIQKHKWDIQSTQEKTVVFKSGKDESLDIPALGVTAQTLHYATELERIV
jgi:26S proteasome regulatory subunit N12